MSAVLTPGRAAALPARERDTGEAAESTTIDANRVWEIDRTLMLERSERRAWWVAIAGLVLGLVGIAAVFVQGPLRRVVEIPIVVDRVTGEATIQQRLSVETIPPMEALDKLVDIPIGKGPTARTVTACISGVPQSCTPGMSSPEVCDGVDNNCSGAIDEGLGNVSCGVGACARTISACVAGASQSCSPGTPGAEVCDGTDNNCNGSIDETLGNFSCGVGICARTVAACIAGATQVCSPGTPGTEICNGLDDDCNGTIDNGTCGPVTTCPINQTVNPNTTVALNTTASSPAGRPFSCAWTVAAVRRSASVSAIW